MTDKLYLGKDLLCKCAFVLAFYCITVHAGAQDIRKTKLDWTVTSLFDLDTKVSVNYSCSFTTNGTNDILWTQSGGKSITTFHVTSISGDWTDVQGAGSAVFSIEAEGEKGTLTFKRFTSGITIVLDLSQSTDARLQQQYSVSRISNSN